MRPPRLDGGGRGGRTREVMTRVLEWVAKNGRKRMNVPTLRMLFREKNTILVSHIVYNVFIRTFVRIQLQT